MNGAVPTTRHCHDRVPQGVAERVCGQCVECSGRDRVVSELRVDVGEPGVDLDHRGELAASRLQRRDCGRGRGGQRSERRAEGNQADRPVHVRLMVDADGRRRHRFDAHREGTERAPPMVPTREHLGDHLGRGAIAVAGAIEQGVLHRLRARDQRVEVFRPLTPAGDELIEMGERHLQHVAPSRIHDGPIDRLETDLACQVGDDRMVVLRRCDQSIERVAELFSDPDGGAGQPMVEHRHDHRHLHVGALARLHDPVERLLQRLIVLEVADAVVGKRSTQCLQVARRHAFHRRPGRPQERMQVLLRAGHRQIGLRRVVVG